MRVNNPGACTCPDCGADVPRAKPTRRPRYICPKCGDGLETQNMEGVFTKMCPVCHGMFFPCGNLDRVLHKLRSEDTELDLATLKDLSQRAGRAPHSPKRYRGCPTCDQIMEPWNYGEVSGVVLECCPQHGVWVDEVAFGELAEFVCTVGKFVAPSTSDVRAPIRSKPSDD